MEKKQKTLEDVKKEIRSLLISSPVGLRLQDLISDYRTMMGKQLPFKEFGYSSVLEMIKHMPDVVAPVFRPGGTMFLEGLDCFSQFSRFLIKIDLKCWLNQVC